MAQFKKSDKVHAGTITYTIKCNLSLWSAIKLRIAGVYIFNKKKSKKKQVKKRLYPYHISAEKI